MVFFIASLTITPMRRWLCFVSQLSKAQYGKRLSDWNFLIRARRMLGLYCFFYSSWHMVIYINLEMDWLWLEIIDDIKTRYFLSAGLASWIGLVVLAITSPGFMQKRMGRQWRRVHRGVYIIAIILIVHLWLEAKLIASTQWLYLLIIVILLGHRLLLYLSRGQTAEDTGMEAFRRPPK